jgi:molecular chaperone GrpE (heat shock protein)
MLGWLRSRSGSDEQAQGHLARLFAESLLPVQRRLDESVERLGRIEAEAAAMRTESSESSETLRKMTRSLGRTALRVEEIERKLDAAPTSRDSATESADIGALFDALDLLDRMTQASRRASQGEVAVGLEGVSNRIARFLDSAGFTRIATLGVVPDGHLFKVVGTAQVEHATPGTIIEVVRAAIRRGDLVVREGEVITAAERPADPSSSTSS